MAPTLVEQASMSATLDQLDRLAVVLVAATNTAIAAVGAGELSFPQWRLLMVLGGSDHPRRLREVAELVSASMPSASRLVDRMARRGLVSSERDPSDGRGRMIALTERGEEVRSAVIARRRSLIEAGLRGIPLPPAVADSLRQIVAGMVRQG